MAKPRIDKLPLSPKPETVIYVGDLKCKISLTPRTATASDSEAALRTLRSSRFFERDEVLYRMRRNYAARLSTDSKKPADRRALGTARQKHEKRQSSTELPAAPFLAVGNWPQCAQADRERPESQPTLQKLEPQVTSVLHTLPRRLRTSPRMFEAVPVKSFVMVPDCAIEASKESWGQCEFYRSFVAFLGGSRGTATKENSPQPASPALRASELPAKANDGVEARESEAPENRKSRQRLSLETRSPPKLTSLTPLMHVNSDSTPLFSPGFRPRALPAKLHNLKATVLQQSECKRRHSAEVFPHCDFPSPSKPSVASINTEKPEHKGTLKSYTVELLPRGLPPHRIPVDYGLFRKVRKLRK